MYLCNAIRQACCLQQMNGIWCNGNTTDSGPVIPGSNPGIPTRRISISEMLFCCIEVNDGGFIKSDSHANDNTSAWLSHSYLYRKIYSSASLCLSIALIFSRKRLISSLSFCTFRFISSIKLLPFLLLALRKPRLFSYV